MNEFRQLHTLAVLMFCLAPPSIAGQEAADRPPFSPSVPIPYFTAHGMDGSRFRASDRELAEWALDAWARASDGALTFVQADEDAALLRIYWVPANFGQYGEMRPIMVDGQRGAEVYVRPDTDALGENIARRANSDPLYRDTVVYLTCLHEIGHALGLVHTAEYADVMYFFGFGGDIPGFFGRYRERIESREDIADNAGLSTGDLAQLSEIYPRP